MMFTTVNGGPKRQCGAMLMMIISLGYFIPAGTVVLANTWYHAFLK